MMKKLFPAIALVMAFGISSCQKCVECDCPVGGSNVCVDDFDSKDDYDAFVSNAEALGCDCKEKLSGS